MGICGKKYRENFGKNYRKNFRIAGKIAREKKWKKLLDNSRKNCKRKKVGKISKKFAGKTPGKIAGKTPGKTAEKFQ